MVFLVSKTFLMLKKKGFTLLEMTLVIIISASLLTTIYGVMTFLPKVKNFNDARQNLMEQTNKVMDQFAILFQDYSIDYEEYFNRKMVGCDGTEKAATFKWNVNSSGHCEAFTAYGNENAKLQNNEEKKQHHLMYCSSDAKNGDYIQLIAFKNCQNAGTTATEGVFSPHNDGRLSYGQYQQLFRDMKNDTDQQSIGKKPQEV